MQPIIGRKKSVKKIELKDTKRSSKYVLTHQQQDEYGEVVTNLIKGDIIKSPSGGSSVIFTDIERLQLKSPQMPRVRRPTNGLLEQNRFIIQDKVVNLKYIKYFEFNLKLFYFLLNSAPLLSKAILKFADTNQ